MKKKLRSKWLSTVYLNIVFQPNCKNEKLGRPMMNITSDRYIHFSIL